MSHELIYSWLNLPAGTWPPDHYTLLGLEPGADDVARIEEQVQQRLEKVRHYQLTHPEQATEAMNRLAQALICLTDPSAKKAYDLLLFGKHYEAPAAVAVSAPPPAAPPAPPPTTPGRSSRSVRLPSLTTLQIPTGDVPAERRGGMPTPARATPANLGRTPLPPVMPVEPLALPPAPPEPPPPEEAAPELPLLLPAAPVAETPPPSRRKEDTPAEAGRSSRAARRGLGTKRALYQRIVRTRGLLHAWEQAGRYLAWPKKRLNKAADAAELVRLMGEIRELLRGFPPLLGEAGQPGYLVLMLARQQAVVPTFQTLLSTQRAALARDWWAGRELLESHRDYLRQEVRGMRRKRAWGWTVRAVGAFLTDQPGWVLVFLALLALNVAIWRTFFPAE
jgi:hypothetical protein